MQGAKIGEPALWHYGDGCFRGSIMVNYLLTRDFRGHCTAPKMPKAPTS